MSDTVTLALQGTVPLSEFSTAVTRFHNLVTALAAESQAESVEWQIDALEAGSASMTARGVAEDGVPPERIDRVVSDYLEVGRALERQTTIPYPPAV